MIPRKTMVALAGSAAALMTAVASLVVACSPEVVEETASLGKACATDTECPYYLTCVDRICLRRCSSTSDRCYNGATCQANVCRPYNPGEPGYIGTRSSSSRVPSAVRYAGYGETLSIPFTWHDTAGEAAPQDLSVLVEIDGERQPVIQVFSIEDKAFVRAGREVRPLAADRPYRVVITRRAQEAEIAVVPSEGGSPVLETRIPSPADTMIVERPSASYRQTIQ